MKFEANAQVYVVASLVPIFRVFPSNYYSKRNFIKVYEQLLVTSLQIIYSERLSTVLVRAEEISVWSEIYTGIYTPGSIS